MTEWQGAMLLAQLQRFLCQHRTRNENALYLNGELAKLPGVYPQKRDQRTTAQGYYCYVVRIDAAQFGLSRDVIKSALEAEGIPMTASYPVAAYLDAFATVDGFAPRHRDRSRWPAYQKLDLPVSQRHRGDDVVVQTSDADGYAQRRERRRRSVGEDPRERGRTARRMMRDLPVIPIQEHPLRRGARRRRPVYRLRQ